MALQTLYRGSCQVGGEKIPIIQFASAGRPTFQIDLEKIVLALKGRPQGAWLF
jgi:hypothetical protein